MRWFSKERILAPARAEARLAAVLLIIRRHNKSLSYAHARITALSSSLFCVKKWEVTQGRRRSPVNPCFFFFFVSHLFIFCRVAQPRCRMQNTGTGLRANKMSQKERRGHARTGVKAETDRLDAIRCPINKIKKQSCESESEREVSAIPAETHKHRITNVSTKIRRGNSRCSSSPHSAKDDAVTW